MRKIRIALFDIPARWLENALAQGGIPYQIVHYGSAAKLATYTRNRSPSVEESLAVLKAIREDYRAIQKGRLDLVVIGHNVPRFGQTIQMVNERLRRRTIIACSGRIEIEHVPRYGGFDHFVSRTRIKDVGTKLREITDEIHEQEAGQ